MSDSGSGKSVSTGIRIGTVSMQVNATTGAHQNTHDAVFGTTSCLRNSLRKSR